jgi:RNA polymerase sigma-70 factor (ECF subfamily)
MEQTTMSSCSSRCGGGMSRHLPPSSTAITRGWCVWRDSLWRTRRSPKRWSRRPGSACFEGRSSFRTWFFRILTNQAKRRGQREARSLPFAAISAAQDADDVEYAVAPERFLPAGDEWAGHWVSYPLNWRETPEERFLSHETRAFVQEAIAVLPLNQRLVITMRDVEGFPAAEVCNALAISETNQRVLLHRARSKVREQLERYLEKT